MAFRIADSVIRGEIDNRLRDHVVGRIWVAGVAEPIRLNLTGNCLRDIAGLRLVFRSTKDSVPLDPPDGLNVDQDGCVGDMTGSRKVKTFDMSTTEFFALRRQKIDVPTRMANCLYLEWFSESNGRVVIETVDFEIEELSDPEWSMTAEEAEAQGLANVDAMSDFLHRLDEAMDASHEAWADHDGSMDEFEWERFLRDSDERSERFGEVFEKHQGHPDAEKLIAREMGWEWLDDALDADEKGLFDEAREAAMDEDIATFEPNPETEGIDWIRTDRGDIRHPLSHRAYEFQHYLWTQARECGLAGSEEADDDVMKMIGEARMLSAKLAGALNSLGYDRYHEAGFVVACLKRALTYFDTTMAAMTAVHEKRLLDEPIMHVSRCELFEIRESILELMRQFRAAS